ncbi:MAG: translation initiation factor IF-3 [Leptospirillia bacterium]
MGGRAISSDLRVNENITVPRVRLIADDGEQLGVVDIDKALAAARDRGLDLVEVAPQGDPPVCRFMDYSKQRFQARRQQQKARSGKVNRAGQVKEVKFRPRTDDHDIAYKVKNLLKFLSLGQKVKVSLFFRGRERSRMDMYSAQFMPKVIELIGDAGVIEQSPRQEGNCVTMMVAPKSGK